MKNCNEAQGAEVPDPDCVGHVVWQSQERNMHYHQTIASKQKATGCTEANQSLEESVNTCLPASHHAELGIRLFGVWPHHSGCERKSGDFVCMIHERKTREIDQHLAATVLGAPTSGIDPVGTSTSL